MKRMVVLTGAGVSAESGIATFRDSGGLWENYDVMDVASPEGWNRDRRRVNTFYNERRLQLAQAEPNAGHSGLVTLENQFEVQIITQNVDDLHERAGSSNVLHLHGELTKVRSCDDPDLVYDIGYREIDPDERGEDGGILRPDIVWFGEGVPAIEQAVHLASRADIFVIVGTSLAVYPAAGIVEYLKNGTPIYLIDPQEPPSQQRFDYTFIQEPASSGVSQLIELLG